MTIIVHVSAFVIIFFNAHCNTTKNATIVTFKTGQSLNECVSVCIMVYTLVCIFMCISYFISK